MMLALPAATLALPEASFHHTKTVLFPSPALSVQVWLAA